MPKSSNPLTQKSGMSTNIILTVVVVVVAVLVIGGVLLFSGGGPGGGGGDDRVSADVLRKPESNTLSEAPGDKVTVVEFLDYQCPACQQYYTALTKQVEADYQGRIDFVVRNFPLDMHPLARPAAQAAEAAAMQGKFKEMYHALYDNWQSWAMTPDGSGYASDVPAARAKFEEFARQIGLDMARFAQDYDSQAVKDRIEQDIEDGEAAGVSGTPTIFVNGQKWEPTSQTYQELSQEFRAKLDQELAR